MPTGMGVGAGSAATSTSDMKLAAQLDVPLTNGDNGDPLGVGDWMNGYNTIEDVNAYLIDFIIAPSLNNSTDHTTLVNHLTTITPAL